MSTIRDIHEIARAIKTLVETGYTPKSVSEFIKTSDVDKLRHTGTTNTELRRLDEDTKSIRAETMNKFVREGWEASSVITYMETGDIKDLQHTGYVSVQLYKPNDVEVNLNGPDLDET